MSENVVLTVGNAMMGDDGAGPYLFQLMQEKPIETWSAVDGGSTPENVSHLIREMKPKQLLIVDATEMGQEVGALRTVDKDLIAEMFFMSTHNMPLNFLIEQLETDIEEVVFVGIQPDVVSFMFPLADKVKNGVEHLYDLIKRGDISQIEKL
ncbi:hydrogenase 3 maturation endopeptidase HyCI [Pasteurellaceae bacterium LFhippo2]|nr:hydrogenase 3 maturation endopeptidase HyCI [Pasteurellaceae bacterium LFhippo2]